MIPVMAWAKCAPSTLCSLTNTKSHTCNLSTCVVLQPRTLNFHLSSALFPQSGLSLFSPWDGLRHLGTSIRQKSLQSERTGRCKGKVVYASLFGVGAPEALVIGVVALLVFGPKGLAEVARNLGKTLRAFQPTIKELQDVSREFKNTLEREIGLDDIQRSTQNTYSSSEDTRATSTPSSNPSIEDSQTVADSNGASSPNRAYSSEEYLKITEEQLKASVLKQEEQLLSPSEKQLKPQPQATGQDAASQMPQQKSESDTPNL